MKHKKILIVGAGISGSTLAVLLENQGISPTVVEIGSEDSHDGYGITIMPRGLAVLEKLGIRNRMEQVGSILEGCKLYDEGEILLNSFALSSADIESITLNRGDLLRIIRSKLKSTNILWNTTIQAVIETSAGVRVTFTNGKVDTFDLMIGADGVNSTVRSDIFPSAQPQKVGAAVWMLTLPETCSIPDRTFAKLFLGSYRFFAIFPYKQTAAVAFTMPLECDVDPRAVDFTQAFSGMSAMTDRILQAVDKSRVYCGHLQQLKLDTWYKGRTVLIGDAAHAMLPATGMGASNGIEDADVLSRLIAAMPLQLFDELPARYQKIQKPNIRARQRDALIMGHVMLMPKYRAATRNKVFRIIPSSLLGRAVVRQ